METMDMCTRILDRIYTEPSERAVIGNYLMLIWTVKNFELMVLDIDRDKLFGLYTRCIPAMQETLHREDYTYCNTAEVFVQCGVNAGGFVEVKEEEEET